MSPVIAIEQKKGNNNPRSTVGTVTDTNDYLRLLFATAGTGHCPECSHPLKQLSAAQIAEHISALPKGTVVELRAPVYKIYGEDYSYTFQQLRTKGFKHLLIDGAPVSLSEEIELDESAIYKIEMVIDRFTLKHDTYIQLTKTIEAAMLALDEDILIKVEVIGEWTTGFTSILAAGSIIFSSAICSRSISPSIHRQAPAIPAWVWACPMSWSRVFWWLHRRKALIKER